MFKRPNPEENEEDLLLQQEEFLKSLEKPKESPKSTNVEQLENPINIIGDIIEKRASNVPVRPQGGASGFPEVFQIDKNVVMTKAGKKKSLFALKMEASSIKNQRSIEDTKMEMVESQVDCSEELRKVHEENTVKLKNMSREEIEEERNSLENSLNPELLAFLKARGAKRKVANIADSPTCQPEKKVQNVNIEEVEANIEKYVDKEWMNMDTIEPEKLQWIGDIPDSKALEKDQPYTARFDFAGDLQPFLNDIDVRKSLHHHGDEEERPGYSIQELYQLARSTVLQQRILGLNTLANIIRKTKMGYYDRCFDGFLLKKLVESDVFFLLRFAMDDRATITAAVNCIHEFFVNRSDEICLNRLLNVLDEDIEPFLFVEIELDKDTEEGELKDHQILAQDIIKGVIRTDLCVRFNYILNEFDPDQVTIAKIFECLIRICRHSVEAAEAVYNTPGLVDYIFKNVTSQNPIYQGISLIRVLISCSPVLLKNMSIYSFDFILKYIDMDQPAFKLKLECLSLWKVLLRNGVLIDEFAPCFLRLFHLYIDKVDICHGRFDFELFAGIVSVLNLTIKTKRSVNVIHYQYISTCLEKWLTQIVRMGDINFSLAKAINCALRFISLNVEYSPKDHLPNVSPIFQSIKRLLMSTNFPNLVEKLLLYSHITHFERVNRDPVNLPSLNSIYSNGSDHLCIVQDNSVLPLFIGLTEYFNTILDIPNDFLGDLLFFNKYVSKCLMNIFSTDPSNSWFSRYEINLATNSLQIFNKIKDPIRMELAFKCIPHYRSDDELVLYAIKTVCLFIPDEELYPIYEKYFSTLHNGKILHSCGTVPHDWVYGPITSNPVEILKFLVYILNTHAEILQNVSYTIRYYRLCLIFLNEDNIFNADIKQYLVICFRDILSNFEHLDFNIRVSPNKSFYELYTELICQYAGTSYGDHLFAQFVTLPLAQKFDISFRKLLWSEYMHVLRVITLPTQLTGFIPLNIFVDPIETDESLLALYLNATSKQVLTRNRNGFIYSVAVENVKRYLKLSIRDAQLSDFLEKRISALGDESLKKCFLSDFE